MFLKISVCELDAVFSALSLHISFYLYIKKDELFVSTKSFRNMSVFLQFISFHIFVIAHS